MNEKQTQAKKTSIGGQALIEGIMMRGPQVTAMAVRHVSGNIIVEDWETQGLDKPKWMKLPFIRGIFNFIDSMRYGYKCLMRSAELCGLEDEEAPTAKETTTEEQLEVAETGTKAPAEQQTEKPAEEKKDSWFFNLLMVLSAVIGIALAVVLFIWAPAFLFGLLAGAVPALNHAVYRGIFEGVFRIVLFVGYIMLVSLMKDIRRVFMYHGAEHKTIFCYEQGLPLTVENIRKQRRFHPRCGTSFMILMLLIGMIVSMLIPPMDAWLRTAVKILTVPAVVCVGYEVIKLAGRKDNWFTRAISKPGMWMQRLTTKEPDDSMIECAIAAMEKVIPENPEADRW